VATTVADGDRGARAEREHRDEQEDDAGHGCRSSAGDPAETLSSQRAARRAR
jgi:hypothetical protein